MKKFWAHPTVPWQPLPNPLPLGFCPKPQPYNPSLLVAPGGHDSSLQKNTVCSAAANTQRDLLAQV